MMISPCQIPISMKDTQVRKLGQQCMISDQNQNDMPVYSSGVHPDQRPTPEATVMSV